MKRLIGILLLPVISLCRGATVASDFGGDFLGDSEYRKPVEGGSLPGSLNVSEGASHAPISLTGGVSGNTGDDGGQMSHAIRHAWKTTLIVTKTDEGYVYEFEGKTFDKLEALKPVLQKAQVLRIVCPQMMTTEMVTGLRTLLGGVVAKDLPVYVATNGLLPATNDYILMKGVPVPMASLMTSGASVDEGEGLHVRSVGDPSQNANGRVDVLRVMQHVLIVLDQGEGMLGQHQYAYRYRLTTYSDLNRLRDALRGQSIQLIILPKSGNADTMMSDLRSSLGEIIRPGCRQTTPVDNRGADDVVLDGLRVPYAAVKGL